MIKSIVIAVVVVLALNLLAMAGVVGWLGATDRLSRDRVDAVVAMFTPTLATEAEAAELAANQAEADAMVAAEEARLASAATGLATLDDRLRTRTVSEDLLAEASARMRVEREAIERRLNTSEQVITKLRDELAAERERFAEFVDNQRAQKLDEDFQQAVAFYEQLQPKQAKESFEQLIAAGGEDEVIDYLSAMQLRKAGAVLREFKSPNEVAIATGLLSRLRERGLDPLARRGNTTGQGGNG
ncbi:MAG: hypothetical protein AAGK09_06045 [Planctomycetota bacterium]